MSLYRLENTIQEYAWGSPSAIPDLLGVANPAGVPMAELWMGAHPKAPSNIVSSGENRSLLEAITSAPVDYLGRETANRFGNMLPFLFKVLAAGNALSIQAHPDASQAEEGFEREERAGIPVDSPERNYRDRNHKPELLCALTEFHALCGFRSIRTIAENFSSLRTGLVSRALAKFRTDDEAIALRHFLQTLLTASGAEREETVSAAVEAAPSRPGAVSAWVVELNRQFPGDIGVLAPLFLNLVKLDPGEAIYLDAGVLHSYLGGTAVEVMANSDNVLRGGLTRKHIDVPELERLLTFTGGEPSVGSPVGEPGIGYYRTPAAEFELSVIHTESLPEHRVVGPCDYPSILLCTSGEGRLVCEDRSESLRRGSSFFVSPSSQGLLFEGNVTVYRAAVPSSAS